MFLLARIAFAALSLLTAFYCLLAYLPFTYHEVHRGGLLAWLDVFVRFHGWFYCLASAILAPVLVEHARCRRGPLLATALSLSVYLAASGAALVIHPVLSGLEHDSSSLLWGLLALAPLAALAVLDIGAYSGQVSWPQEQSDQRGNLLAAALGCGIFVPLVYAFMAALRGVGPGPAAERAGIVLLSLASHVVAFLALFLAIWWLTALAGLFQQPSRVEFWLCHLLAAFGMWAVMWYLICPPLGFANWVGNLFSVVIGVVVASFHAGLALAAARGATAHDGISVAAAPVALGLVQSAGSGVAVLAVLSAAGCFATVRLAAMDWNYLFQKLVALVIWSASFGCIYNMAARVRFRTPGPLWLAAIVAIFGAYKVTDASPATRGAGFEHYAGCDVSFQFARQLLSPPRHDHDSFYGFLTRNTNIPHSVHVDPAPVNLVAQFARSQGERPHIFIFTIDSLRRDYLSPYNSAVTFTPAIGSFGAQNAVFENAFTRYGGTGLSEPAIWSGALLLHKQYVSPFAPMNALEKLTRAEGYQTFLSRDEVLNTILTPSPGDVEIDPPASTMNYRFSRSLDNLASAVGERRGKAPLIFAYTQPQDQHSSVIERQDASTPPGEQYPGFYAPYAARVRRIDEAFGKFLAFLKARGLYENSIIVLTADHGDSLGEEGRWGHAYTLFPEIVRIPLIVHLPSALRGKVSCDPRAVALSTDIAPSLYYLLGHRPMVRHELFGRPLFTETPEERVRDPRASYLLASSYGAVYGMLSGDGRQLYVADAVNYRDYLFHLGPAFVQSESPGEKRRAEQQRLIRESIRSLNRFYQFGQEREVATR